MSSNIHRGYESDEGLLYNISIIRLIESSCLTAVQFVTMWRVPHILYSHVTFLQVL